jgi:ABC-type spermidine/putrescine transport system permease subunit I
MRRRLGAGWLLIGPAVVLMVVLLVAPLLTIANESFKSYVPGRIGGVGDFHFTFANYADMLAPAYLEYFGQTLRIGFEATLLGLALGYPIAYLVARQRSQWVRKALLTFLFSMLFMSILVRVYALLLTFGSVGMLRNTASILGYSPNSFGFTEILVIAGLLHVIVPMIALTLVGTIQNINPSLEAAALVLGAPRWKTFLAVTLPLSSRGIMSAFLIAYTLCISAFVVPLILGKGVVLMVANLIYSRFSEVANFPGGAAIAVLLLVISLAIVYGIMLVTKPRWE